MLLHDSHTGKENPHDVYYLGSRGRLFGVKRFLTVLRIDTEGSVMLFLLDSRWWVDHLLVVPRNVRLLFTLPSSRPRLGRRLLPNPPLQSPHWLRL